MLVIFNKTKVNKFKKKRNVKSERRFVSLCDRNKKVLFGPSFNGLQQTAPQKVTIVTFSQYE